MSAGKEDSGMSISKYNSEGYPDPTAQGALEIIEQEEHSLRAFRPIVYICSPYAGDIEANVAAARRYSRFAVNAGYMGGDTGHGGRTYFRIKDEGCTDMEVRVMRDRFGDTEGFEVMLGGDCELETMIRALKFITKVLGDSAEEVYD